ncbi:MAG: response regulator transcription factor [Actinomycetota bacterium]|jgi:DNA-binding response OmpR family regulator|nr:response regulator transcription factor [Actinomycetota bacterium]
MRVLFVEDEPRLREALCRGLSEEGHEAVGAGTGTEGLQLALHQSFDVIVCDILLPGVNGFQLVRRLREQAVWTPVLMLSAKDGEWDEAEALDAGADGYITKPFSYVVLKAHLRALARRGSKGATVGSEVLRSGDLILDLRARRCARGGTEVELSQREFSILAELLAHRGEAVAKDELMRKVWGPGFAGDPNIVEVYIGYLRKKVDVPFGRHSIETVRGYGYRLTVQDEALHG